MYYLSAKFGDDMSRVFLFYSADIHTYTHIYKANDRPTHAFDYGGISNKCETQNSESLKRRWMNACEDWTLKAP